MNKHTKVLLSLSEGMLAGIDSCAKAQNYRRSELIREILRRHLLLNAPSFLSQPTVADIEEPLGGGVS